MRKPEAAEIGLVFHVFEKNMIPPPFRQVAEQIAGADNAQCYAIAGFRNDFAELHMFHAVVIQVSVGGLCHQVFFMLEVVLGVVNERRKNVDHFFGTQGVRDALCQPIDQVRQLSMMLVQRGNANAEGVIPGNRG